MMGGMSRLTTAHRARIVAALVEDNGIRATARMCDVAKNTVGAVSSSAGDAVR